MKSLFIVISVLTVIFIIFQSFISMGTNNTEKQPYTVLKTDGEMEIRLYPSVTMATIESTAKNYRELSGNGFRKIAGYIFGNNASGEKIAMTTPVHMDSILRKMDRRYSRLTVFDAILKVEDCDDSGHGSF
jgi:hypothetical protein